MAVSKERASAAADVADRELVFTRVFDAPRGLVFEAWTDPAHLAHWWGPRGFAATTHEMDVRPGGDWRLVMHGPDGVDYRNRIVYREVVRPERLVYEHVPEPGSEPVRFEVTVTFEERGGKTALSMRMLFPSTAALAHVVKTYGAEEGAKQTLERLREQLARMTSASPSPTAILAEPGQPTIVMTRVFAAPRRLVFEAWTRPEHLARWWGPRGYALAVCDLDLRPGGAYRFVLRRRDGQEHGFGGVYREIVPPERLVYTFRFDGAPDAEALETVVLLEREGRTLLQAATRHGTVAARDAHLANGMEPGARETLERLADHLATLVAAERPA